MKHIGILVCMAALLLSVLSGCGNTTETESGSENSVTSSASDTTTSNSELFTNRDYQTDYEESESVSIQLNGTSASCDSNSVTVSGSTVTITEEGTYLLSGELEDGSIVINVPDSAKVHLVLNGVQINSETSAALYVLTGDKVFITLSENTENTLSNGGTFTAIDDNNIDGAVFSKQDLTFNGSGSLTVTSPCGHGIVCKDDLVFTGGTYTISAANHGLDANDSVRIDNATLNITAGKDGIHAENNDDAELGFFYMESGALKIEAEGDGVSAAGYLQMEDGTVDITAGGGSENGEKKSSDTYGQFMGTPPSGTPPTGGQNPNGGEQTTVQPEQQTDSKAMEVSSAKKNDSTKKTDSNTDSGDSDTTDDSSTSMKGLKSDGAILLNGGTVTVNSADDSIHSNDSVTINGGTYTFATGDDGIHGNNALTVNDGAITITESYEGLEATNLTINGGTIDLTASDDGLNAAGGTDESGVTGGRDGQFEGGKGGMSTSTGSMTITGGEIKINASGDGIDSNGTLSITGGSIQITGANVGDTSILDFDTEGIISGGAFIGTGSSNMAQNFSSSSTQGVIMVSTGSQEKGTVVTLTDSDGNKVVSFEAEGDYSCVILSTEKIKDGKTYTLTAGTYETTITMDGTIHGSGTQIAGGGGNPGGRP